MRKQTIVRSIRIDSELDSNIQKIAKKNRINYNTLIVSVLSKYADWDNRAERFGYVFVPREVLLAPLQELDDETIKKIGREIGPALIREMIQFWYGEVDLNSFIEYMTLISKYQQTANYQFALSGSQQAITIHHYLGEKWSMFIGSVYQAAMKNLFAVELELEVSKSQVTLKWADKLPSRALTEFQLVAPRINNDFPR